MQGIWSNNRSSGAGTFERVSGSQPEPATERMPDYDLPPAPSYDAPPAQTRVKPAPSVIGQDIAITGNVTATADLQIDGRIDGDARCGGLSQGPEGRIKGNVVAESARLGGTIEGAVSVRNLTIASTARITGDVAYETIAIENGAHIDGRLKHQAGGAAPAAVQPQAVPAQSYAPADPVRLVSDTNAAA